MSVRCYLNLTLTLITAGLSLPIFAQATCDHFQHYQGDLAGTQTRFKKQPEYVAWQWFVCLNGKNTDGEYSWEEFKSTTDVFLADGRKPNDYPQPPSIPAAVLSEFTEKFAAPNRKIHNLAVDIQVDGFDLLDTKRQRVRYQLLMNQAAFDYIVAQEVYNLDGQARLAANNEDLAFPVTAWELKLSWFWIGDDQTLKQRFEEDQYIIVPAYYQHDRGYEVGYAAMSGMHIVNKLTPDWTWSTFEHIDNNKYLLDKIDNETGPTPAAISQNAILQEDYPPLAKYQLIGVQSEFVGGELLANAQMESAFQSQSSCIACHQRAAINADGAHLSYATGWVDERLTFPVAAMGSDSFPDYSRLDFVWSLRNAQWRNESIVDSR